MSGGISGTGEFDPGLYKIYLEDLEKSGELTPFQIKQDTLATLGGNYLGQFYLAPGGVPFLDSNYKPIFSLDKMTPELFAWLMIRNDLDKISAIIDEFIYQITEDEGSIDLLKLLKTISDAIKDLEKQIEEAKDLDADKLRSKLEDLAKQADEAYEKLHKTQLLLNLSGDQLKELQNILSKGGELPEKYEYLKDVFGELVETWRGRKNLAVMFDQIIEMKERGERLEEREDRMGKSQSGNSGEIQVQGDIERMSRDIQSFNHALGLMGIDPKLINSIITIITQLAFKNYMQGNEQIQKILLELLQDDTAMFYMFSVDSYSFRDGYGINDLEKQIIGIITTMVFTLIYMQLQDIAELDGEVTKGEEALMKLALGVIILNMTSNETFREIMGEDAIEYMQSEEFLNNLIFTARFLNDPEALKEEMTLSEGEIEEIIQNLLENKNELILELLKNLKMLKAMYAAVLAMISGGSDGGNILELLKGLKAMMVKQPEEIIFHPPDQPA